LLDSLLQELLHVGVKALFVGTYVLDKLGNA